MLLGVYMILDLVLGGCRVDAGVDLVNVEVQVSIWVKINRDIE